MKLMVPLRKKLRKLRRSKQVRTTLSEIRRGRTWVHRQERLSGFGKKFALFGLVVLIGTTIFWSILGANTNQGNADQLVNAYLFNDSKTFHGAQFPGQHSFLIKWPIFWLLNILNFSSTSFVVLTVLISVATVLGLAFLVYKIERRPVVFGFLCLALASALLLVPAQPYPGGILPVNMAMLTTRNIEYLFYIAGLVMILKWPSFKNWRFWVGAGTLLLLVASDKLFLTLGLGAAGLSLVTYALLSNWEMVGLSAKWLMGMLAAGLGSLGLIWTINRTGLTHITNQGTLSPYGLVHNFHDARHGLIFGLLGVLTNFGANAAHYVSDIAKIPSQSVHGFLSLQGPLLIINVLLFLGGIYAALRVFLFSLMRRGSEYESPDNASRLSTMLLWTAAVAFGVFALSNHYWPVDSRYLTIWLFAIFICAATFTRRREWSTRHLVSAAAILVLAILVALPNIWHSHQAEATAMGETTGRNQLVVQVLQNRPTDILVGDYWRVVPTKYLAGGNLNIMPLDNCTEARQTLSSQLWRTDLAHHKFAYLLSLDKGLTDFPTCNLDQIVKVYGRPNSSALIAGAYAHPKELLLFYDHGANMSSPVASPKSVSTVVPISIDELPYTSCPVPTLMNIVAHEDDDLLFTNPDLLHEIKAGHCVRTVYVTAGDAGYGQFYWLNREQGSEAAYSTMLGQVDTVWVKRIVELSNHEFITVANPRGDGQISLIFMNLPDGNLKGQGFRPNNYQSLAKLSMGMVPAIDSVDKQSYYSKADLADSITSLLHVYQPANIHTQSSIMGTQFPDHSDHLAVSRIVQQAYKQYEAQQYDNQVEIPIKYYMGYPVRQLPPNVSGSDLVQKEAAWLAYGAFDGTVCHSVSDCNRTPTYQGYLARQYSQSF